MKQLIKNEMIKFRAQKTYVVLSCIVLVIGNFLADLLYTVADPRIKTFGGKR